MSCYYVEIKMNTQNAIQGIANINTSSPYPVALELIFINNDEGKGFLKNLSEVFKNLPEEKDYLASFKSEPLELTSSIDVYFKNKDMLKIIIYRIFKDFSFYDERDKAIIQEQKLIIKAEKLFNAVDT